MSVSLDRFSQAVQGASDATALRFDSASDITTASRGLGGRIVRWFRSGLDRQDNLQMAGKLVGALAAKHGPEVAAQAFRMARGDTRTSLDGGVMIRPDTPITARQVREAIGFAQSLSKAQERAASTAPALLYSPENAHNFARVANGVPVDPDTLSPLQKSFYRERLAGQLRMAAEANGRAATPSEARDLAAKTLAYTAGLDPTELRQARAEVTAARAATLTLLHTLGGNHGPLMERGVPEAVARNPSRALMGFLQRSDEALGAMLLGGVRGTVGGQDLTKVRMQVLEDVVSGLSPAGARHLYKAAMASDGPARTALFALAAQRKGAKDERDDLAAAARSAGAADLQGQLGFVLNALAERGGMDLAQVEAEIDRIGEAGGSLTQKEILAASASSEHRRAAGISGGSSKALEQARDIVMERGQTLLQTAAEADEQELLNFFQEMRDYADPEPPRLDGGMPAFPRIASAAGVDPRDLSRAQITEYRERLGSAIEQAHRDGTGDLTETGVEKIAAEVLRKMAGSDASSLLVSDDEF